MEKSMLKRTQIPCIPSINWDHKNWYAGSSIKPISCGYGGNYNFKGSCVNLPLHSVLKPILLTAKGPIKSNKRGLLWVHIIRATSSSDKGGDDAPDQSKHSNSVFSVFAGIIEYLIRLGILGVLYREKKTSDKIEEKIENVVEIVEEVADSVKDIAEVTEEIAENVKRRSREGGFLHETAEIVDEISEKVGMDAQIVEKEVEKIKKTIKTMDEKVGKAEDAVKDIGEIISGEASKEHGKDMDTAENSSIPIVETDKDNQSMDSVEVVSKSNFEDVGFKGLLRRFTWLPLWARKLLPKILEVIFVLIFPLPSKFAGIIGYLIRLSKGILAVLYREKKTYEIIEEKIENAVEIVEEAADSVKVVAEVTEEIAEEVIRRTREGGFLHEMAEIVDEISERVDTDAQIVEKEVEKIKKTIKTMDEKVGKAEDAVKDIAEIISGEVRKEHDKDMDTAENSSVPIVETEEKIENALEIVEEVADSVRDVAEATEEIAENVKRRSREGGIIHKTDEIVDKISEKVGTDTQIVEKEVEKTKKTIKTMDEKVGKAEDTVKDIAEITSGEASKEHDKDMDTAENSSVPIVETDKDKQSMDSVEVVSKSNFEDVGFKE